jgi:hypothetical protein
VFRLCQIPPRIWDRNDTDRVVYDNQLDAPPGGADPTAALGGDSIVLHVK